MALKEPEPEALRKLAPPPSLIMLMLTISNPDCHSTQEVVHTAYNLLIFQYWWPISLLKAWLIGGRVTCAFRGPFH